MADGKHRVDDEWATIVEVLAQSESLSRTEVEERADAPERVREALDELCGIGLLSYDEETAVWTTTELFTGFGVGGVSAHS